MITNTHQSDDFKRYYEIVRTLVDRNLKVRYRGSFLGVYWSLLNPLIMTGVYTAIFGATFAEYYGNSTINYVLAAFTGLAAINFFSASTSQALTSIVDNGQLLNKIKLPFTVFPLSMILANLFQFCAGTLPLLILVTLITSRSAVNAIALIVPVTSLVMVCLGIGYLVSALYVFFRDLPYFYELVTFVIWISSPVFYPAEIVSDKIKPFLQLNPISSVIESIRQIALSTNSPDVSLMLKSILAGIVVLTFGWVCFQRMKTYYMDLI